MRKAGLSSSGTSLVRRWSRQLAEQLAAARRRQVLGSLYLAAAASSRGANLKKLRSTEGQRAVIQVLGYLAR